MILGIGNDLVDIRRIEQLLAEQGERFEKRVFTLRERQKANSRKKSGSHIIAATYAKRFAAKEACAKALGTGISWGVTWHHIEITNIKSGAPVITLNGEALLRLKSMTPKGAKARILVTLSDEYPLAQAQIIIVADYD